MELIDNESRRWRCKKDNVTFLTKEGWSTDGQIPASRGQVATSKSYAVGLVANFLLPGAGVIYAGKKIGIVYTILTVVFLVVFWPIATVVAVASYVHTIVAVKDRNMQVKNSLPLREVKQVEGEARVTPPIKENGRCGSCGGLANLNSVYCLACGTRMSGERPGAVAPDSERTRLFE